MELSHIHDKMEIANSPYPQVDDIDLDLNNVRQQSIDRSMADDADLMQADTAEIYYDDDMLDDEALQTTQSNQNDIEDLNMDALDQDDQILEDDAIEEAASVDMAEQDDFNFAETSTTQIENDEQSSHVIEGLEQDVYEEPSDGVANTVEIDRKDTQNQNITVGPEEHATEEEVEQDTADATDVLDFAEQQHDKLHDEQLVEVQSPFIEDEQIPSAGSQDAQPEALVAEIQPSQPLESSTVAASETAAHEDATAEAARLSTPEQDGAPIQTAESLHPITVVYLGQVMSLFPPMVDDSSATFFVSDTSLAYEPIVHLLAGCREILGQSLEHDDELVLDIPTLGLHICEDSDFAGKLTLSQVVEVYLTLCRNESAENIEPLYCSLSSRVCLASQFAYLERSAADGKTFSEIVAEHADSPEQEVDSFEEQFKENDVNEAEKLVQSEFQKADTKDHSELPDKQLAPNAAEDTNSINNTDVHVEDTPVGNLEDHEDVVKQQEIESEVFDEGFLQQETTVEASEATAWQSRVPDPEGANEIEEHNEDADDAEEQGEDLGKGETDTQHVEDGSSASSHTIEGEDALPSTEEEFGLEHANTLNSGSEHNINEDQDELENLETAEDLFSEDAENDVSTTNQEDNNAQTEARKNVTVASLHQAQAVNSNGTHDHDQPRLDASSEEEPFVFDANENADEFDFLGIDEITSGPPITPSKSHNGKRKAFEEEEELDFNEISTPEPKRTRAS